VTRHLSPIESYYPAHAEGRAFTREPEKCGAVSKEARGVPDGVVCLKPLGHDDDFHQGRGGAMWWVQGREFSATPVVPEPEAMPYVCPGCHAVGEEPCGLGCLDAEIEADHPPRLGLPAGLAKDPATNRQDEAAVLGNAHEPVRVDESVTGSRQAEERLDTGNGAGLEIDLRLVVQHELALFECVMQRSFNGLPR